MAKRRAADFDLEAAFRAADFTPRAEDLPALFARLEGADAELAERAIARAGVIAANEAMARIEGAKGSVRASLLRIVGRAIVGPLDDRGRATLLEALRGEHGQARRAAARVLGGRGGEGFEPALIEALDASTSNEDRRALVTALGKIGGAASLDALGSIATDDPELARLIEESRLKISRTVRRERGDGHLDATARPARPLRVALHTRGGLEEILCDEAKAALAHAHVARASVVEGMLDGALERIFAARTMIDFGFPLPAAPIAGSVEGAVARAIASDAAWEVFSTFTRGAVRYRLDWSSGHRRAAVFRVAREVAKLRPALENDPTASPWQCAIAERRDVVHVELRPRVVDPRYPWRRADVPASSHPAIAAALARVAGVRDDDVVWDPFVGAASELIERARLGPYRAVVGTDVDDRALAAARSNLEAAHVERVTLARSPAESFVPPSLPTLVLTNPPMGRRVRVDLDALFDAFLAHLDRVASPRVRIVWLSPIPDRTVAIASRFGFSAALRRRVDLGGFSAELQHLARGGA